MIGFDTYVIDSATGASVRMDSDQTVYIGGRDGFLVGVRPDTVTLAPRVVLVEIGR